MNLTKLRIEELIKPEAFQFFSPGFMGSPSNGNAKNMELSETFSGNVPSNVFSPKAEETPQGEAQISAKGETPLTSEIVQPGLPNSNVSEIPEDVTPELVKSTALELLGLLQAGTLDYLLLSKLIDQASDPEEILSLQISTVGIYAKLNPTYKAAIWGGRTWLEFSKLEPDYRPLGSNGTQNRVKQPRTGSETPIDPSKCPFPSRKSLLHKRGFVQRSTNNHQLQVSALHKPVVLQFDLAIGFRNGICHLLSGFQAKTFVHFFHQEDSLTRFYVPLLPEGHYPNGLDSIGILPRKWKPDELELIEWFRASTPPKESFNLAGCRKVLDPGKFWASLSVDIEQGPSGARGTTGALIEDIRALISIGLVRPIDLDEPSAETLPNDQAMSHHQKMVARIREQNPDIDF